jgi:hypothetical protein
MNLGQQCLLREQCAMVAALGKGRSFSRWEGHGEVSHIYRGESRVCF